MRYDGFAPMPESLDEVYTKSLVQVFREIDRLREEGVLGRKKPRDEATIKANEETDRGDT